MKIITTIALISLLTVVACKKDTNTAHQIKFAVIGTEITEFKISNGDTEYSISTPFTGTKDTTIFVQSISTLKLDAKGDGPSLIGTIFIDNMPVISAYDSDEDGDYKTQVKTEYPILK